LPSSWMFHLHHHCFTFMKNLKKSKFAKKNQHRLKNIKIINQ
jgi:hypothetical protein